MIRRHATVWPEKSCACLGMRIPGIRCIPYKVRTDDWWWADIQALYEAGSCPGVMLGSQGTIEQALHWQCDESQLLFD